jgi:hypothetical protein
MHFWRRRKTRRLANLALLLIELEQLAGQTNRRRRRVALHF